MNVYGIIIVITLALGYMLDLISEVLNLKSLGAALPEEFRGIYSDEAYEKSQKYTQVRTKYGFITSTFSLLIVLIFWFFGGFNYLDNIVRGISDSEILRGVYYIGILLIGNSLLSLPFSVYSTFFIEEKFGFNKTTPKTFIVDLIKGFALSIVIGGPILAGVIFILGNTGEYAWLYGWVAVTIITIIMQFLAPTLIMPLFNKFTPLKNLELKEAIMTYAKSVKFSLKNIFEMDGSKRSSKSNAFFTGFGRNKRIALFDTLIEKHSINELVAILAHEIGHYKKKHIIVGMIISILHTGVLFYLMSIFLSHKGLYDAFFMDNIAIYTGLIFFAMLYSPVEMILSIFMHVFSRKNEYEADRFAATTTNDKDSMINALKKLSEHNLSNLTPHPFYVFLNYSHPPVLERIKAIRKIEMI